ncbi:MAG TPA: FliH/SctL family protein [bacterium]
MHSAKIKNDISEDFRRTLRQTLLEGEAKILSAKGIELASVFERKMNKLTEKYDKEMSRVKKEEKKIYEKAKKSGIANGEKRLKKLIDAFLVEKTRLFQKVEEDMEDAIFPICEKVLMAELKRDYQFIMNIITQEVSGIMDGSVRVLLNDNDIKNIQKASPKFIENLKERGVLVESAGNPEAGSCKIITGSGEIDPSPLVRLKRLKSAMGFHD